MNIKLVKYENEYAKGVAQMWNESAEFWGGLSSVVTEESTINEEENSACLDLTLAKLDDEVIGYCKLSVDHHDEGALYIDLLNVTPEHHGKSIGKMLLLDSIEKTIKRGWRRLDLFTWGGNTKAIPLYKKCGFFWEKRDATTHLINLMPDVLGCELVSDFFETADWYKDSTREIKLEADSRIINGFDLWNYEWEKDGKKLNMEYSRRGRGLKRIESDELIIDVIIDDVKLVFGNDYKVKYLLTNKTDRVLEIKIDGVEDKNVKFDFSTTFELTGYKEIETTFFVDKIDQKQKENRTHPVVKSIIEVDNKKATFMTGIEPLFPLSLEFKSERAINKLDVETECYIDIKNQCGSPASFDFEIENNDALKLTNNAFSLSLDTDEKASVKTTFVLNEAMMYNKKIKIKTVREGKSDFEFEQSLNVTLQADYGKFSGENDEHFVMANGEHRVELVKENNVVIVTAVKTKNRYQLVSPKLGKPFTQEFEKKRVTKVEFDQDNDWIKMTAFYDSKECEGISFKRIFQLHSNGIVRRWFELSNDGKEDKNIEISETMYLDADRMIAAYNNKFVSLENETSSLPSYLESSKFNENWLYTHTDRCSYGFIWPKEYNMQIGDYSFVVEYDLKTVKCGEKHITKEVVMGANAYSDWHDVREHALGKTLDREELVLASEFEVNGGNPFVGSEFDVIFREHKNVNEVGKINVHVSGHDYTNTVLSKQEDKNCIMRVKLDENRAMLELESLVDADMLSTKRVVYQKSNTEVKNIHYKKEGLNVYCIDNGVVKFECAPEFAPSVFSIKHNANEWLTSSFPTPKPFSWWKSWIGGACNRPMDINLETLIEEESTCQFIKKRDSFGNEWHGLEICTSMKKNVKNKDLQWKQYYMTLPGVPIIAYYVEFVNNNNEYTYRKRFLNETFLDSPTEKGGSHFRYEDTNGRVQKVLYGQYERDFTCNHNFDYRKDDREDFMTMYANLAVSMKGFFSGTDMIGTWGVDLINTEAKKSKSTAPGFIIFGKNEMKDDWLNDFVRIKF